MDEESSDYFEIIERRLEHIENTCGDIHVENVGWMVAHEILVNVLLTTTVSQSDNPSVTLRDVHYKCASAIKRKLLFPDNNPDARKRFTKAALRATERFFSNANKI